MDIFDTTNTSDLPKSLRDEVNSKTSPADDFGMGIAERVFWLMKSTDKPVTIKAIMAAYYRTHGEELKRGTLKVFMSRAKVNYRSHVVTRTKEGYTLTKLSRDELDQIKKDKVEERKRIKMDAIKTHGLIDSQINRACRYAGLLGVKDLERISGMKESTLNEIHDGNWPRFEAIINGAAEIKAAE